MAGFPEFNHIHCSSRNDRPVAALEADLDTWMAQCSLITLTQVQNDRHAAAMREKGWAYYNSAKDNGSDHAGIAWRVDTWAKTWSNVRRLIQQPYQLYATVSSPAYIWAAAVILRHRTSGRKLLVVCTAMPPHLEGRWTSLEEYWLNRKRAYMAGCDALSNWCEQLQRLKDVDGIMIACDWNLNLRDDWYRDFLIDCFGPQYHFGWTHYPTAGTSLGGNKIIDGTLVRHLKVEVGAVLLPRVESTNHRPYKEQFKFVKGEIPWMDPPTGSTQPGVAWWGFGDYDDDEIYAIERELTGAAGGEVL